MYWLFPQEFHNTFWWRINGRQARLGNRLSSLTYIQPCVKSETGVKFYISCHRTGISPSHCDWAHKLVLWGLKPSGTVFDLNHLHLQAYHSVCDNQQPSMTSFHKAYFTGHPEGLIIRASKRYFFQQKFYHIFLVNEIHSPEHYPLTTKLGYQMYGSTLINLCTHILLLFSLIFETEVIRF